MTTSKSRAWRLAALGSCLAFLASCDSAGPSKPAPAAIAVVSGDGQATPAGAVFGQPIVVKVSDATGAGVPGLTVTFQVTSGSGSVNPAAAVTDTGGRAQTTVTAGTTPGALVITARVASLSQVATAQLSVLPPLGQLAGRWVGTTSQNRALTLWVGATGVMDSLRVQISVTIISGLSSCVVTFVPANIALASDGSFTASLASPSQVFGTLSGAFSAATTASGTFQAGWSGTILCGNSITFGGGNSSSGTWQATKSPMSVSSVSPNSGPLAGGTNVTINGWFENPVDSVRIGTGRLGNLVRVSGTRLTGTTPVGVSPGAVTVTAYAGTGSVTCTNCFTYNTAPAVTAVSPASGSLYGGTPVTIAGTGFPTTVDSVRVGPGRLSNLVRVSSTQLTGVTPAGAAGAVDVVVYTTTAGSGGCTACFTYNAPGPVTVTAVSPASGPLAGGSSVTITGTDFPPIIDSVLIGTARLGNVVRVSATQLAGVTPAAGASGAVNVTVYTTSGGSGTCTGCYTYNPMISVTGVNPASGQLAGGTPVTIAGTNFPTSIDSVRFGTGRLSSVVRVSTTQLTGITPAGSALGAVDVTVFSTSAGDGSCAGCYTYTPPVTWASLTAGGYGTCGLTSGSAAYCWGYNFYGRVGDGSTTTRSTAVAVAGGLSFASLASGDDHTCGLTGDGTAYCWGYNFYGSLGDGTTSQRTTPVAVAGGLTFVSLTAGDDFTCGLTSGGAAWCWGYNFYGQLGDSSTATRTTPVAVRGGLTFLSLTAGDRHICGLTGTGAAWCWGYNLNGQLGDSSTTQRTVPVAVAGGISFASLAAGSTSHTCGRTASGVAWCWGYNSSGQLGDSSTTQRTVPVAVAGGLSFASLTAGDAHTCGLTAGGAAYCWGYNTYGQLGNGSFTSRTTPVAVGGGLTFASLAAGDRHTCGPATGGTAYCWGYNTYGQLGDGSFSGRSSPVVVVSP